MERKKDNTLITVGRVFAIISAVICFIAFIAIITIPIGIFNLIAANKLKQYQEGSPEVSKQAATGWSIYLIFTTGWIGGLCALFGVLQSEGELGSKSLEDQLKEIESLYNDGVLTKSEYDERRKKIIENV